jgi:hypothetical protein
MTTYEFTGKTQIHKGRIGLKNGSYVELPENLKGDFFNQSIKEFELALKERGISTYSQL